MWIVLIVTNHKNILQSLLVLKLWGMFAFSSVSYMIICAHLVDIITILIFNQPEL